MGIRFCSSKPDFSFLNIHFRIEDLLGSKELGGSNSLQKQIRIKEPSVPVLGKNQNQRTTQFWFFGKKDENQRATSFWLVSLKTSQETPVFSKELGL
jgi:hypothetical protein